MSTASTVPLSITPEAADYIDNVLRLRPEFERMLDYVRNNVDNTRAIKVVLQQPYEADDEPVIIIYALLRDLREGYDGASGRFGDWQLEHFPLKVHQHFILFRGYEPDDAR
jgi:hypothetical protein